MPLLRLFSKIVSSQNKSLIFRGFQKFSIKNVNAITIPSGSLDAQIYRLKHIQKVKDLQLKDGVTQSELGDRTENDRSLIFFKSQPLYKDTFFTPDVVLDSQSSVLTGFKSIFSSNNIQPISSDEYKDFRLKLLENLPKLSDKELATVLNHLKHFPKSPSPLTPEFQNVWKGLDNECISRLPTWGLDFALSIDTLWYEIFLIRFCDYHWALKRKLFRKCDKLTKVQFIRFMIHLSAGRSIPDVIKTYDLEHRLYSLVDELSLEETVMVALAYFKTETRINDATLLKKLLEKASDNPGSLDSISAASIFKLARHSSNGKYFLTDFYYSFQETFIPEVDRLSITACTHLVLIGTQLQVPHKELIKKVMDKVEKEIRETRLKEFERLTFVMTTYNVDCDSLCHKIVDEIRDPSRLEETSQYGRSLPSILYYLSIRGIFPVDLISKILSPEFLKKYYGNNKHKYQREMLSLNMTVDVELPEYKGSRLEEKLKLSLLKINYPYKSFSKTTQYENAISKIKHCATKLFGGPDFYHICSILPQHHSRDLVFCTDSQNKLIPIPNWMKERKGHEPKYIPDDSSCSEIVYHAIYIVKRGVSIANSKELLGQTQLQLRLLKKIGYVVHIIYANDWHAIENDELEMKHLAETILANNPAIKLSIDFETLKIRSKSHN